MISQMLLWDDQNQIQLLLKIMKTVKKALKVMTLNVTEEKKFIVPNTATEFDLPQNKISVNIFPEFSGKVEEIANSPTSVTTAASSNKRMRTVQSSHLINLGS